MWKYFRNGKLVKECNDIPETMEDAVIELQENGVDVSDCVDDDWTPDYPPEEDEKEVNIDVFGNEIISCWHHEDVTQCDDCIDKLT